MAPRSSVVTVLFLLLTTVSSRALQPDGPTANECRDHIEAAIRNYLSGGQQEDAQPQSLVSPEIYTRAQSDQGFEEDENDREDVPTTGLEDDHQETEESVDSEDTTIEESESDTIKHDEKRDVDADGDDSDEDSKENEEANAGEEADDDTESDDEGERRVERDAPTDEEANDVEEEQEQAHHHDDGDEDGDDQSGEDTEEALEKEDDAEAEETNDKETHEELAKDDEEVEDQVEAPPTEADHFQSTSEDVEGDDEHQTPSAGGVEDDEQQTPSASDDQGSEEDEEENEENENRVERHAEEDGTDQDEAEDVADQEDDHADTHEEPSADSPATDSDGSASDDTTSEQSSPADEDGEADDKDAREPAGEEREAGEEGAEEATGGEEEEEEELIAAGPGQLRTRENIETILGLGEDNVDDNKEREKIGNDILKEIKRMYESAVRPLETLYKFKDISTRQMGDAEIFSKPMVLFIGPWSTGKSAIINYLLGTEYSRYALKTGAEPTSNSFNVIMHGDSDQVLDGTQLAADWAFSTLQKFGQTFLDRLRGRKMPNPLLQKMTIVDSPGILENRKSTERQYPFNDAFQWFIDRADLIYIVFDPTKLDIGMELEAIFDQLKGRENQVRILLNKADTVKPQELMKVQGTLLWNLSPLLGTSEAPTVYVGSFWSRPYLPGSPETLLDAQEEAFLDDLHEALAHRVENKVALSRRHAVRVRNHAKMVDCYLTTYYNHKSFFSNKRKVADDIVENPQNYHIYEGLSILTNVSRYDLPDPDIYREFFRIHPLFDFKPLASTCSYFKGCPLDKLDIAIAYDLPELVGKYQRLMGNRAVVGGR